MLPPRGAQTELASRMSVEERGCVVAHSIAASMRWMRPMLSKFQMPFVLSQAMPSVPWDWGSIVRLASGASADVAHPILATMRETVAAVRARSPVSLGLGERHSADLCQRRVPTARA